MSENNAQTARNVTSKDQGKLGVQSLVLLAILLAAGFILNFFVGNAIATMTGGLIQPEFIISAFCLMILVVRPNVGQALIVGLISAAVIQLTTKSPFIDFAAEGIAAMLMAVIVQAGMRGKAAKITPALGTFATTAVSGIIFMVIKMATMGFSQNLSAVMLPVVLLTAVFNAILVAALYVPVRKAVKIGD